MGWKVVVSQGIPSSFLQRIGLLLKDVQLHQEPERYELKEVNRLIQGLTRAASLGLFTGVGLPLNARNQLIGVLFVFRNYRGRFSSNDRNLLQSFADQAAIAVHNAQLYTKVLHEERRMVALLDSAADGIMILAPDHTIVRCNPAMSRMLGIPVNEIQLHSHEKVIKWNSRKEGLTLEEAEVGGWPLSQTATLYIEGDIIRPNRAPLPVGITYAPLLTSDRNLINIIASVRDITHFREAEELKSTFISVISHELKTPVALIKGYVSTLRREDASWDREVVNDSLEVIEEEADHLTGLIDNLLDASRLQAGALAINLSDVRIDRLVGRIAEKFQNQTTSHEIVVDFPQILPIVIGDEERLSQVIKNLISNSIKYSPSGGEIRISGFVQKEKVIICISDQGPGIAADDVPHVFDRFYRSSDASRTTKGAGLGLYLARAVIEAHGGSIWVDPASKNGAKICFSLPRDVRR
jgi:signal transduction histidine kinase